MKRDYAGAAAVLLIEAYLYARYAQLDAQFHYWLHGLLGAALALAGLTATRLIRGRRRPQSASAPRRRALTAWEAAGLGHLYAAFPDVLFLTFRLPHDYWMDAFGLHITVHFIPAPLLIALALFLLTLTGYGLVTAQLRGPATAALSAAALTAVAAISLASSAPTRIDDLRDDPRLAYHHAPEYPGPGLTPHQEPLP
jgi:hypothetical protein